MVRVTLITLLMTVMPLAAAAAQQQAECVAPEGTYANREYNALVCAGIRAMDEGRFASAKEHFERALEIPLSEEPNFALFSRLALAQFRAGKQREARRSLELARLSLSVLVGMYRCSEEQAGFALVHRSGRVVDGVEVREIVGRMCGAIYEPFYERESFEAFVHDARLVEQYLATWRAITGR